MWKEPGTDTGIPVFQDNRNNKDATHRSASLTASQGIDRLAFYHPGVIALKIGICIVVSKVCLMGIFLILPSLEGAAGQLLELLLLLALASSWIHLFVVRPINRGSSELAKNEEQARFIIAHSQDSFVSMDSEGKITAWNDQAEKTFGWSAEEAIGRVLSDMIIPEELRAKHKLGLRKLLLASEGSINDSVEITALHRNGHTFPVELSVCLVRDGKAVILNAFLHDMTKRKLAEKEIAVLKQEMEHVLGVTKTGIDIIGTNHEVHYVDAKNRKLFGDPTGKKCYEYFRGRDQRCPDCGVEQALATKQKVVQESVRVKDGNRPIQITSIPFENEEGEWWVAEVSVDITDQKHAEKELQESEAKFRRQVENFRSGYFFYSRGSRGELLYISPSASAVFGYSSEDLLRHFSQYCVDSPTNKQAEEHRQKCLKGHRQPTYELEVIRRDGSLRTLELSEIPILDAHGVVSAVEGIAHDVTQKKLALGALLKSEEEARASSLFLSNVLDSLGHPFYVINVHDQSIAISNRFAAAQAGPIHCYKESCEKKEPCAKVGEGGSIDTMKRTGLPVMIEHTQQTEAGTRYLEVHSHPIFDEAGNMVQAIEYSLDITERKIAEQEVRRMSQAVNATADAIMVTDRQGKILSVNPSFYTITGYTEAEAVGKTPRLLKSGEQLDLFYKDMWKAITGGDTWVGDVVNRRKDGTFYYAALTISPILDEMDACQGFVGVQRDVTARRKAEDDLEQTNDQLELSIARANDLAATAEVASIAKNEFLANMSHEIRTPMNGILGMTDLTLDTELTSEQREYLTMVKESGTSLMTLINDILDFSKIEAGRMELDPTPFRLRECLDEAVKALSLRAHEKGLEMICHVASSVPEILVGDTGRFRQIIVNLVGNAIKFTAKGEVSIRAHSNPDDQGAHRLTVTITDTGIGIPHEKQSMVFDQFQQADGSTTRQYGGTGLGLAISRQLAELMDGTIGLTSVEGEGSIFTFTCRMAAHDELPVTDLIPTTLSDVHVLVVDDNATVRKHVAKSLAQWQMIPTLAESGKVALELLARPDARFRLVLLDCSMPQMDGFAVAEAIKANPATAATPIIMLTAAGQRGDAARCRALTVRAYLTKPLKESDLRTAISSILGQDDRNDHDPVLITRHSLRESRRPIHLLLAEDNEINKKLALRLLEKNGYKVTDVPDGLEALEAIEKETFDLVLMDLQMPHMGGLEAVAVLRRNEMKTGQHLPVIAMTAHAMKADRERCLAAGMDGYVSKPIRDTLLYEEIDRVIDCVDREPRVKTNVPLMNLDPLFETVGDDANLVRELTEMFLSDTVMIIDQLRDAIELNDAVLTERLAHTLKGLSATFGAEQAAETALGLEQLGHKNAMETAPELLTQLVDQIEQVRPLIADRIGLEMPKSN